MDRIRVRPHRADPRRTGLLILVSIVAAANLANASDVINHRKVGPGRAYAVQPTVDSGFIVAGARVTPDSGSQILLMRLRRSLVPVWTRTFGGVGDDVARSVQQTDDKGIIVVGWTSLFDNWDICIIKTDSTGNLLWSKVLTNDGNQQAYCIRKTHDHCYIVSGWTSSFDSTGQNALLMKVTESGAILWQRVFSEPRHDVAYSVEPTRDSGYVVTGYEETERTDVDAYLMKTAPDGAVVWKHTYGGAGDDVGYDVEQTSDGGYVLAGASNSRDTLNEDILLVKVDSTGACQWSRALGGQDQSIGYSVRQMNYGRYMIAGCAGTSLVDHHFSLIITGWNGKHMWGMKHFNYDRDPDNDLGTAVAVERAADGRFVIGGWIGKEDAEDVLLMQKSQVVVGAKYRPDGDTMKPVDPTDMFPISKKRPGADDARFVPTIPPRRLGPFRVRYEGGDPSPGLSGTAYIKALVDLDGSLADLFVLRSSGSDWFDSVAVSTFRECRFTPGVRNDETIRCWVGMPMTFKSE